MVGLGLGMTLIMGSEIFTPIVETTYYDGTIRSSDIEIIGQRILTSCGILVIWSILGCIVFIAKKEIRPM